MSTKFKQVPGGQGSNGTTADLPSADSINVVVPSLSEVEKWVLRDVSTSIRFLQAIEADVDLRRLVAQWCIGKIENFKNKPVVDPAQANIFSE